jgi:hypothetical protein
MANFIYPPEREYYSELQFSSFNENVINQFNCQDGKRAGFQLQRFTDYETGKELIISKVYDCTGGNIVYLTSLNVLPDCDLVGGLFSSGVFAVGEIFNPFTKFKKVNY